MKLDFGPFRHPVAKPSLAALVVLTALAVAWNGRGALVKAAGKGAALVKQTMGSAAR
jgi:hypothetical protein